MGRHEKLKPGDPSSHPLFLGDLLLKALSLSKGRPNINGIND